MNIEEFYKKVGGSYAEVSGRIPSVSLIERFLAKFLEDKSFGDLSASMEIGDRKGANLGVATLRESSSKLCEELRGEGEGIPESAYLLMNDTEREYAVTVQTICEYLNK